MTTGSFLERLIVVNIFLVVFNMLPAFPMDDRRVLRSILPLRMDYTGATRIAATLKQGMALPFGFIGFFSKPLLIFIALSSGLEQPRNQTRPRCDGPLMASRMGM